MSSKPVLCYWDIRGLAQPIRLLLTEEHLLIVAIGLEVDHGGGGAHASDGGLVKLFILKPERNR